MPEIKNVDTPKIAGIPVDELEAMKTQVREIKCRAFDELRHFITGDYNTKTSGFKDLEDCFRKITTRAHADCERLMRALERKYPA